MKTEKKEKGNSNFSDNCAPQVKKPVHVSNRYIKVSNTSCCSQKLYEHIMANALVLTVINSLEKRVFYIDPTMLLEHITRLIANNFGVDADDYILEVFNKQFKDFFLLDQSYLDELRSDPELVENNTIQGRIRLRRNKSLQISRPNINSLFKAESIESKTFQIDLRAMYNFLS